MLSRLMILLHNTKILAQWYLFTKATRVLLDQAFTLAG